MRGPRFSDLRFVGVVAAVVLVEVDDEEPVDLGDDFCVSSTLKGIDSRFFDGWDLAISSLVHSSSDVKADGGECAVR